MLSNVIKKFSTDGPQIYVTYISIKKYQYHSWTWKNFPDIFSQNTVPFYGLAFPNGVAKTIVYTQNSYALLYTYLHFMVTFTSMCHTISNICTPFPTLSDCGEKKKMAYAVTLIFLLPLLSKCNERR